MEKCDKHDDTMTRIFESIHSLHLLVSSTESNSRIVLNELTEIKKAIYGDGGGEGLITRVWGLIKQFNLVWTIILLILGGAVGIIFTAASYNITQRDLIAVNTSKISIIETQLKPYTFTAVTNNK